MAAPTFVNAGTRGAGTASVSPGLPAGWAADDLHLFLAQTTAPEAVPAMAGWTEAPDSPIEVALQTRLTVRYRVAVGGDAAPATGDPGNHILCVILGFRGVDTASPFDVTAAGSTAGSATVTIPGDTTTVADCMIVAAACAEDDQGAVEAGGVYSAWANADLASITEAADLTTGSGDDGSLGAAYGVKTAAGAYGNTTATLSVSDQQAWWSGALKPTGGAAAAAPRVLGTLGVGT